MAWCLNLLKVLGLVPATWAVQFGSFRRTQPISRHFGFDRGQPIDRHYIESFLEANKSDIRGHVLEIQESIYTEKFGKERVVKCDVLHAKEGNPKATIVADFTTEASHISSNTFDCIILVQTLQHIYQVKAALKTIYRILKPGGVVLATGHGISAISRFDFEQWGEFWHFTTLSFRMLFEECFSKGAVSVRSYGSVLSAISSLHGLAAGELTKAELDTCDADYGVIIGLRAVKPVSSD